jgi:hypothetical protein
LVDNLTLPDARSLEKSYIDKIGRLDLGTGPLTNLTDGSKPGPETRKRLASNQTKRWAALTPKEKQALQEAISAGMSAMTPESKAKQSKSRSDFYANLTPTEKQQLSEARSAAFASMAPATKRKRSKALSDLRKRVLRDLSPEEKDRRNKAHSEAMKAYHARQKKAKTAT